MYFERVVLGGISLTTLLLTHLPQCCIDASVNQFGIVSDSGLSPIQSQAII